jgi:hypothetical protein
VNQVSQQDKDIRVSDADRDSVVRELGEHASVGRLTLAELEERSGKALEAKTRRELDSLTSDLPGAGNAGSQPEAKRRRGVRWLVSILGSATYRARSSAVGTINSIAILGGGEIDLRNAEIEGGRLTINTFAVLGGADIFVPDSIEVDAAGIFILAGVDEHGTARAPRPGAPTVKLRGFAVIGAANLYRVPPEMLNRPVREIRASLPSERGQGDFELGEIGDTRRGQLGQGGPGGQAGQH